MTGVVPSPAGMLLEASPRLGDWFEPGENGTLAIKTGRVELGQGNLTALLQIVSEELDVPAKLLSILPAETGNAPDEGVTAGSMSIVAGGMALRRAAGALCNYLSKVENLNNFAEMLSQVDWDLPIFEHEISTIKKARQRKPLERLDLRERMIGAPFLHDIELPGMLHGAPLHKSNQSPHVAFEIETLKRRSGVVAVHRDKNFVGILAETPWDAKLAVEWALANSRRQEPDNVTPDLIKQLAAHTAPFETCFEAGKATTNDWTHESSVTRPFLSHGSIGPSAAIALWNEDRLQVWTHSQGIYPLRRAIAQALKMPLENIVVRHASGAGCYGHNGADDVAFDAVLMAREVLGRPVKVVWSRRDEFSAGPVGAAMISRARALVTQIGQISHFEMEITSTPHSTRPGTGGEPHLLAAQEIASGTIPTPVEDVPLARGGGADRNAIPGYDIPNIRIQKRLIQNLPIRSSALRGLGAHANVYAIETLMDKIADHLGEDPLHFRLRHLSDMRAKDVLKLATDLAEPLRQKNETEGIGWGCGFARYKGTSGYCAVVIRAEFREELKVTHVFAAADIGEIINLDGARNQIEGGILQSISWTTKEALSFDGQLPATDSWVKYPILGFRDIPILQVELINRPDSPPLGCGELAQGPTAAALGNAVRSVFGKTPVTLPLNRRQLMDFLLDS